MNFIKHTFILIFLFTLGCLVTFAQECPDQYISKRYTIFFETNHSDIDSTFKDNGKTLRQMRADISATLKHKKQNMNKRGHSHFGNYACFHVGGAGDPACCNCRFCRQHNQIPLQ